MPMCVLHASGHYGVHFSGREGSVVAHGYGTQPLSKAGSFWQQCYSRFPGVSVRRARRCATESEFNACISKMGSTFECARCSDLERRVAILEAKLSQPLWNQALDDEPELGKTESLEVFSQSDDVEYEPTAEDLKFVDDRDDGDLTVDSGSGSEESVPPARLKRKRKKTSKRTRKHKRLIQYSSDDH